MHQKFFFKQAVKIKLPDFGHKPGLLHTILQDESGSLYFTDEVNNSLVCLNSEGRLLWLKSGLGREAGCFRYPKGIDLGWVTKNGEKIKCIAVCDSWNDRIQFFTLDGAFVCQWVVSDETPFKNVVDIRFIRPECSGGMEGFWIVLDRDNHRLCGMDLDGRVIWKTGRMLTEKLEECWLKWLVDSLVVRKSQETCAQNPIVDPLFYPARILGDTEDALFIQERDPRRLKKLSCGNLLPVFLKAPHGGVWISADSKGLLSWSEQAGILSHFDFHSRRWQDVSVERIPISSGRRSHEAWFQNENELEGWIWNPNQAAGPMFSAGRSCVTVSLCVEEIETAINLYHQNEERDLFKVADDFRSLGSKVLAVCTRNPNADDLVQQICDAITSLLEKLSEVSLVLSEKCFVFLNVAIFNAVHAQQRYGNTESIKLLEQVRGVLASLITSASLKFAELARCKDEINIVQYGRQGFPKNGKDSKETGQFLFTQMDSALLRAMQEIVSLHTGLQAANDMLRVQDVHRELCDSRLKADPWTPSPIFLTGRKSSLCFRELDRISLRGAGPAQTPLGPTAMTRAAGSQILVTLFNANGIARLDTQGKFLGILVAGDGAQNGISGPYGMAVDAMNRVWISEAFNHQIWVLSIQGDALSAFERVSVSEKPVHYPFSLCCGWNGSILVADTGNNRIISLDESGKGAQFGGAVIHSGGFRHPIFLFRSPHSYGNSLWVVDSRNHRLQELDSTGSLVRVVGSPGLGKNSLSHPESAAQFEDGVLAVSQYTCHKEPERGKAVKVFSPDGEELGCQFIDYDSRGMLVHHGFLLVADPGHDCIHVYERI
jgi:hypothetical protein